jgi:phosphate transport system substrate-binding protein
MTTRIGVAVHPSNTVRRLSHEQLRQVLRGEIKSWAQLGGDNRPLRLVLVGGGGGVTSTAQNELLDGQAVSGPHILFVKTGLQVVQVVEQEPNAIGFGQVGLIKSRGVPEVLTERAIQQTLSMVTLGEPTPAMQSVIDAARRMAESMM